MVNSIQEIKNGRASQVYIEQFALKDPVRQETLIDTTSETGGNVSLSSTIRFGERGGGILGLLVSQKNSGSANMAAWNATIKAYDKDGVQIGSDITQTIPLTPSGRAVWTQLNISQQTALLAQYITITGTLVAAPNTTHLRVYFTEQSPGINVSFDAGDNVAQETGGNLATIKTNTDPFVTASGGAYIRQDSTGTIAKETGGNLATIATNTTRDAANTARSTSTLVLPVQPIDASGNVLGRTAANTARTTGTLVDPVQVIDASGNVFNLSAANTGRSTSTLVLPVQMIDAFGNVVSGGGGLPPATHVTPIDGSATYTSSTTITCSGFPFTVDELYCMVSYIMYRPSGGSWRMLINGQNGVSMTASSNVITVSGAGTPFASGDTYRVGLRYQDKAYVATTNSLRVDVITRQDNLATSLSAIASNATVTKNTEMYWPAGSTSLTSCWDAFSLNAGSGLAGYIGFTVQASTGASSTPRIYVYATDDPNTTVASKRWVTEAFLRNGSYVTEITMAANTSSQRFLFYVPICHRYYAISIKESDNQANVTGVYIDASVLPN